MRVVTVALRSRQSGRIAGYVQYGRNEQHVDSTIDRLWLFIAAGVLGATLLASLAGVAIARRAMRPISSLTATAREIAETGDPSRHMPQPRADDEVGELAQTLEQMLRSLDAARAEREAALKQPARVRRRRLARAAHAADQHPRQPRAAAGLAARSRRARTSGRWSTRRCAPRGG